MLASMRTKEEAAASAERRAQQIKADRARDAKKPNPHEVRGV